MALARAFVIIERMFRDDDSEGWSFEDCSPSHMESMYKKSKRDLGLAAISPQEFASLYRRAAAEDQVRRWKDIRRAEKASNPIPASAPVAHSDAPVPAAPTAAAAAATAAATCGASSCCPFTNSFLHSLTHTQAITCPTVAGTLMTRKKWMCRGTQFQN